MGLFHFAPLKTKLLVAHHRSLEETNRQMEGRDPQGEETDAMVQAHLEEFKQCVRPLLSPDETGRVDNLVIVAHRGGGLDSEWPLLLGLSSASESCTAANSSDSFVAGAGTVEGCQRHF